LALYPEQEDDVHKRTRVDRYVLETAWIRINLTSSDQENDKVHKDTIFFKGLELGKVLEDLISDGELRRKVLAEFWAEIILYVTPSDNVRGHVEQLANGGEFITHIRVRRKSYST
jgi:hypothetical protein